MASSRKTYMGKTLAKAMQLLHGRLNRALAMYTCCCMATMFVFVVGPLEVGCETSKRKQAQRTWSKSINARLHLVPRQSEQCATAECLEEQSWRALNNAAETFSPDTGLNVRLLKVGHTPPTVALPQCTAGVVTSCLGTSS